MKSNKENALVSSVVLIGGGHAHVHVLKMFGMEPDRTMLKTSGIEIILIARDTLTPYSGMLPGHVAGHYTYEEIHVDLNKLCAFSGVKLIHASAIQVEYNNGSGGGLVYCSDGRPPVRFDVLSIDVGINPTKVLSSKSQDVFTPVKPISTFSARFEALKNRLKKNATFYTSENPFICLVVGGGAGGVELCLSVHFALQNLLRDINGANPKALKMILATRGTNLLPTHNPKVGRILEKVFRERKINIFYESEAIGVLDDQNQQTSQDPNQLKTLKLKNPGKLPICFHECLWCTSASAPSWLASNTPFPTNSQGFLQVEDTYQCVGYPGVFAAGDCCEMVNHPRPKSGVYAVRAGPPLKLNIKNYLLNYPLYKHYPQSNALALISTGDKYCIASKSCLVLKGTYLWKLKDYIDRTWMNKYSEFPKMEHEETIPKHVSAKGAEVMLSFTASTMRCGGCGAKVGSTVLSRVLENVRTRQDEKQLVKNKQIHEKEKRNHDQFMINPFSYQNQQHIHTDDDAAVVLLPENKNGTKGAMIHTIDFFRSFISDPFIFGQIAAVHSLSDCHAMGAIPSSALALAIVPYAAVESITESILTSLLSGANDVLIEEDCQLVGGHTCEGLELGLGFSINGYTPDVTQLFYKRGGKVGDKIILTKPIGTGALFAADMRALTKANHVHEALCSMKRSNGPCSRAAVQFETKYPGTVHSCTDVTGFGLVGHLLEMLMANDKPENRNEIEPLDSIGAAIDIKTVPFLNGAIDAMKNDITSSLYRDNARSKRTIINHEEAIKKYPYKYPLLFDPQTAGGLMFFVSNAKHAEFITFLNSYCNEKEKDTQSSQTAYVIGEILPSVSNQSSNDSGVCVVGNCSTPIGKRISIKL